MGNRSQLMGGKKIPPDGRGEPLKNTPGNDNVTPKKPPKFWKGISMLHTNCWGFLGVKDPGVCWNFCWKKRGFNPTKNDMAQVIGADFIGYSAGCVDHMGVSLNGSIYPQSPPQNDQFLVGKPMGCWVPTPFISYMRHSCSMYVGRNVFRWFVFIDFREMLDKTVMILDDAKTWHVFRKWIQEK